MKMIEVVINQKLFEDIVLDSMNHKFGSKVNVKE